MKLKYSVMALAALLTLGATTSCEDFGDKTYLDEVCVTSSYLSFEAAGSSCTIEVNANAAWTLAEMPEWLTANPASGSAGKTQVTFTAQAATETRQGTFFLVCDGASQRLNYIQQTAKVETPISTCAQVNAGVDDVTYRVQGAITKIAESATYGNFYLSDGTGEVYVYGTKYQGETKQGALEKLGLAVGDIVVVEGPRTTYGSTIELKDVDIISYEKSLIKCDSTQVAGVTTDTLGIEGGEITAYLTNKGNKLIVSAPEAEWLSLAGVDGNVVTFRAEANLGGDRETTVTFQTTDGKKTYSATYTIYQKGSIVACSVADFLAAEEGNAQFRLTAAVTSVSGKNVYVRDFSDDVLVYNPTLGDNTIKAGDIITVVGKRASFKGTAQMGSPVVEAVTPVTTITIPEVRAVADDKTVFYLVTGKVVKSEEPNTKFDVETYGNFSLQDAEGNEIYVYGLSTGVGGASKQFGTLGVKEGDTLTVIGYKTTYLKNDYALIQLGGAMYFSHTAAE